MLLGTLGCASLPPQGLREIRAANLTGFLEEAVSRPEGILPSVQECLGLLSSCFKSERRGFHAVVPPTRGSI